MTPQTEAKLARVRRYSRSLKTIFRFFQIMLAILGCLSIVLIFAVTGRDATVDFGGLELQSGEISILVRVIIAIGMALIFGVGLKLLHHLAKLCELYAEGEIFTAASVRQIRQIGITILLFFAVSLYSIVANLIIYAAGQSDLVSGSIGTISIGIDGDSVFTILGGIVIIVISWIMDVGREMREEQDLTV